METLVSQRATEAVSFGHPDKIADIISDTVLDMYLSQDPNARVACETLVRRNKIILAGEVSTQQHIPFSAIHARIREVLETLRYSDIPGFRLQNVQIDNLMTEQSANLASFQENGLVAGDQGIMFGYATDETTEYLPLPKVISQMILNNLTSSNISGLYKDAKCLVVLSDYENQPSKVNKIIVSVHHKEDWNKQQVFDILNNNIIPLVLQHVGAEKDEDYKLLLNPAGLFTVGGPAGDTGLTGRKIIVDTYGGEVPHGGGAFSGKDPSKVDRSAAMYARYVAKNIVASGICHKCLVKLSYVIGNKGAASIVFDTMGTSNLDADDRVLTELLIKHKIFNFNPEHFVNELGLKQVKYLYPTVLSPFMDSKAPWEQVDKVPDIQKAVELFI